MFARLLKGVLGLGMIVAGILLSPLPGPWSIPLIATGLGLILAQSTPGRRVLHRIRLWARDRFEPDRVRDVERRMPRDIVEQNTQEMRLNLEEYEKRRRRKGRRRD